MIEGRFPFTRSLDVGEPPSSRLAEMLRGAKAWLAAADLGTVLDSIFEDRPSCRALFDDGDQIDHVGFLLPPWAKPLVSQVATAAGFPLAHRAFPSSLVARELGRLVGKRRLETQIFKAYGHDPTAAFEAFIPSTDDAQVERWIRDGACNHVAVAIGSPERFARIRAALVAAGMPMSGFMYDRAVYLPGEDATIMYFDTDRGEYPFRLEIRAPGDLAHD